MLGWLLTVGGIAVILVGVLMNMDIYFRPTSLWETILMFGLIGGGSGCSRAACAPRSKK